MPSGEGNVTTIKRRPRKVRPIGSLFMVDVLTDADSRPTLIWALTTLSLGTVVYHFIEGWNFLDSLYFCVISLATVGYGDFTPKTPYGRAFTIFYVINGIVVLLSLFDRIRAVRARKMVTRRDGSDTDTATG
jgi:voltage-gated potassium channel